MHQRPIISVALLAMVVITAALMPAPASQTAAQPSAILWINPADIASRDLFHGSGGLEKAPHPPYTFLKEDLSGTNPKFIIRDGSDVEWNVKLGIEAQPEIAATRLVWAVGYLTNDEYYLEKLRVDNMPAKLQRGQNLIASDGSISNARLKRKDLKKTGSWSWNENPFLGTRELNGLKVMMALINNWDLKDVNNSIYQNKAPQNSIESLYMVSDLGASFSGTGFSWPKNESKGNLKRYVDSKFISNLRSDSIDFAVPSRPAFVYSLEPWSYIGRLHQRRICEKIPRADALWIGKILARLSHEQIRDAFRAAGYAPPDVEGFTQVVLQRISELNKL